MVGHFFTTQNMKKAIHIICFVLLSGSSMFAQVRLQQYIVPTATCFLSGAMEGLNQTLAFNYDGFQRIHPRANPQFWDNDKSWKNKWKLDENGKAIVGSERYLGSSTFLAWTTDGYHLSGSADWLMIETTIFLHPQSKRPKRWGHRLLEVAAYSIARKVGFHLTYSILYK